MKNASEQQQLQDKEGCHAQYTNCSSKCSSSSDQKANATRKGLYYALCCCGMIYQLIGGGQISVVDLTRPAGRRESATQQKKAGKGSGGGGDDNNK